MNGAFELKNRPAEHSWFVNGKTEPVVEKMLLDSLAAAIRRGEQEQLWSFLFNKPQTASPAIHPSIETGHDLAYFREVLQSFIYNTPLMLPEIEAALRVGPSCQALKTVARLRVSLSVLGLQELTAILQQLDEAIRADEQEEAQVYLHRLTDGFHQLCPLLQQELLALKQVSA